MTIFADDDDDYHHILKFEDVKDKHGKIVRTGINDVESLLGLFAIAVFMNALDRRTYLPFAQAASSLTAEAIQAQQNTDINAIPLLERRHCCYVRGLAFDLLGWFYNHYKVERANCVQGYSEYLAPFVAGVGRDLVRYKAKAYDSGIPGVCTPTAFEQQIKMSLFGFQGMEEGYKDTVRRDKDEQRRALYGSGDLDLPFSLEGFTITPYTTPQHFNEPVSDYFREGRNRADNRYFHAVKGGF